MKVPRYFKSLQTMHRLGAFFTISYWREIISFKIDFGRKVISLEIRKVLNQNTTLKILGDINLDQNTGGHIFEWVFMIDIFVLQRHFFFTPDADM